MIHWLAHILIVCVLFAGFCSTVDAYMTHAADNAPTSVYGQDSTPHNDTHQNLDEHGCCHATAHLVGSTSNSRSIYPIDRTIDTTAIVTSPSSIVTPIPTPPPRT